MSLDMQIVAPRLHKGVREVRSDRATCKVAIQSFTGTVGSELWSKSTRLDPRWVRATTNAKRMMYVFTPRCPHRQ